MTLDTPIQMDPAELNRGIVGHLPKPIRLAILAMHPVQYHSPLYRNICSSPTFQCKVLYLDKIGLEGLYDEEFGSVVEWDIPLLDGHEYKFLSNWAWNNKGGFFSRINPGLINELRRGNFDVILIQGYSIISFWIALFVSRHYGVKVVWRGEVTPKLSDADAGLRQRARNAALRYFLRRCDAVMYTCSGNKDFLIQHGMREEDIFPFLCAVDNDHFRAEYAQIAPRTAELRQSLGIPDNNVVVVFCGRLIERKRPRDVLEAIKRAGPQQLTFLIIGDGPQRDAILEFAKRHDVHVVHLGFVNQSQISLYYTIADIFCLLSEYDPSPKALNEAMNFSLVPIVSDTVGTSRDLIKSGETGFRVALGDVDAIAEHLSLLRADPKRRRRMAQAARDHVATFSFSANAQGLEQASRSALGSSKV